MWLKLAVMVPQTNTNSPIPLTYTLIEPVNLDDPTVKITGSSTLNIDSANFSSYINKVYIFILVIVAVISVFMIMRGGIMYLTTDIVTDLKKGREIVVGVLSGLIFIFCIYLIFWLVNPQLLNSNFVFKGLESVTGSIGGGSNTNNNNGIITVSCGELITDTSPVVNQNNRQVCKNLSDKLKEIHSNVPIIMTSAIRDQNTESKCHISNNPFSGSCADIVPNNGDYDALCKELNNRGLEFLNESGKIYPNCGTSNVYKYTTGSHIHVYLKL